MTEVLQLRGKLRLKAAQRKGWLRSAVERVSEERYVAAGFGSYPDGPDTASAAPDGPPSVEALLDQLQRDRRVRVRLTYMRSPVVIEGLLPADVVGAYWPLLVGAFDGAAGLGGKGELALTWKRRREMRVSLDGGGGEQAALKSVDLAAEAAAAAGPVKVPGVIEPARSGRASCRYCKRAIAQGALRFGAENVAKSRPGKPSYRWLHLACAVAAMPFSVGPVLREYGEFSGRDALWDSLSQDAQRAPRPRALPKGTEVVTNDGLRGVVTWYGPNKYGSGMRVGVKHEGRDDIVWLKDDEVRPIRD